MSKIQYLLMVNDPPKEVIESIEKSIHNFMWKGKARGITRMEELMKPETAGGLNLPDIKARQTAARLMWIKKWRNPLHARPTWADILDELVKECAKKSRQTRIDDRMLTSIFDQTWREIQTSQGDLSRELRLMIKAAWNYNIEVDALKFTKDIKGKMPVWFPRKMDSKGTQQHSVAAKQLREFHGVITQSDAYRIKADSPGNCPRHHLCVQKVNSWTKIIHPKFVMSNETPQKANRVRDTLDHTPNRLANNEKAKSENAPVCLNPDVTHRGDWAEATRIFRMSQLLSKEPAYRNTMLYPIQGRLEIYTDGSATKNGQQDARCAAGVWSETEPINLSLRVQGEPQTNNRGEIAAVVKALEIAPINRELIIYTDSTYVINGLTDTWKEWKDLGWLQVANSDLFKKALYLIRIRTEETWIQKVKAHSDIQGNEEADKLAKAGLDKENYDVLNLDVPIKWDIQGAKLSTLRFKDLYRWVIHLKPQVETTRASTITNEVVDHIKEVYGIWYKTETLWKSLRTDPIRREVSDFLWKALHGKTECGEHFKYWQGWQEKQFCKDCGALETLEHILVTCQDKPWRNAIWKQMIDLLNTAESTSGYEWETPSYYEILGSRLINPPKPAKRLAKIVYTETAFTIWKIRNRIIIDEETIVPAKAVAIWNKALKNRAFSEYNISRLPEMMGSSRVSEIKSTWRGLIDQPQGRLRWVYLDEG